MINRKARPVELDVVPVPLETVHVLSLQLVVTPEVYLYNQSLANTYYEFEHSNLISFLNNSW